MEKYKQLGASTLSRVLRNCWRTPNATIHHIPRDLNEDADILATSGSNRQSILIVNGLIFYVFVNESCFPPSILMMEGLFLQNFILFMKVCKIKLKKKKFLWSYLRWISGRIVSNLPLRFVWAISHHESITSPLQYYMGMLARGNNKVGKPGLSIYWLVFVHTTGLVDQINLHCPFTSDVWGLVMNLPPEVILLLRNLLSFKLLLLVPFISRTNPKFL